MLPRLNDEFHEQWLTLFEHFVASDDFVKLEINEFVLEQQRFWGGGFVVPVMDAEMRLRATSCSVSICYQQLAETHFVR